MFVIQNPLIWLSAITPPNILSPLYRRDKSDERLVLMCLMKWTLYYRVHMWLVWFGCRSCEYMTHRKGNWAYSLIPSDSSSHLTAIVESTEFPWRHLLVGRHRPSLFVRFRDKDAGCREGAGRRPSSHYYEKEEALIVAAVSSEAAQCPFGPCASGERHVHLHTSSLSLSLSVL